MPRITRLDHQNTRNYIPIISNEFDQPLQNTLKLLEKRYFHEGRVVSQNSARRNYSSTEQVNLIQQLFAYCLLTGTKVDIGEIIYSDLVTRLTKKSRQKYVSFPRFVSCALEVLLDSEYTRDESFRSSHTILSNLNFSKNPSKVTPIELTPFMVVVNNNKKLVNPLPFTIKKKKGKSHTVDKTQSTRLTYQTVIDNEGNTSYEVEPGIEPLQLKTFVDVQAFLLFEDELAQESDDEEVFIVGEDMDEDTQATEEEHQSSPSNTDKPKSSYTQDTDESASHSSSPRQKKYDNILPLTERQWVKAFIEGYYKENVDHRDQIEKVINASMNSLDKNNITRGDFLNALNEVTKTLKAIQDAAKEDYVLNKKVTEATEAYIKNSTYLIELLTLIKNFDLQGLKSSTSMSWNLGPKIKAIENTQAKIKNEVSSLRQDTLDIKYMMTEIYQAFKGHIDKEDQIKKSEEEAKRLTMTKTEVIKIVQEKVEKIIINPNKVIVQRKKEEAHELEPEIKVSSLGCNRNLPEGVSFVNNIVIEELEYGIFFTDVFGDQAFHEMTFIRLRWIL
uniref:Uncharacterized protein n=1 Tax=Tanacetum cinerariifolium TaxID=118510 RepID=A0A6L2JRF1_TANCI|nr:hypothetical protein [Tanacetum cinerariifolium]